MSTTDPRAWAEGVRTARVIGTGVMGRGIAQLMATAGLTVELADTRADAIAEARDHIERMLRRAVDKGRLSAERAASAVAALRPVGDPVGGLDECDLVIEAVREDLDVKRELFAALERACPPRTVLATNTSSLSVTAIASGLRAPERFLGLHFFNPAPLMRLVEVVPGARTAAWLPEAAAALVRRLGHEPVRAPDTPGFLVNHAGRGLGTEALHLLAEGVAEPVDIDRIARDVLGLRMGPFELFDLTGLDVSHHVLETIWTGFHGEPRLRPPTVTGARLAAGLLGRKSGEGFYRYVDGVRQEPARPSPRPRTDVTVWISAHPADRERLLAPLRAAGVTVSDAAAPPNDAVVLVAPYGCSAAVAALEAGLPPQRTVGVDPLGGFGGRLTVGVHPALDPEAGRAAVGALAATGRPVTVVRDGPAPVAQRLLASIVNVACSIAELRLAAPADIDTGARLGLGYPRGPLEWGDAVGAERMLTILRGLHEATGDPRYRPSPWLAERAALGLPLTETGTLPADLLTPGRETP
ncbi:3-hydroxyacyl-CoA dehydrogenase [Marinactinospora thermotolerans]|uniref:3-hydroxybutyryl-CoA dehydrogenase n=1 Tax=Marinactinospora thermotolerans DSM 45154 TaxID=1122192 RepID=A0A1T4LZJ2_9ACTN|nr:3-hydroxyacyl-CoA dehydrogenase [Marinactinospora thermotolerans]SJZ60075.1 3-hydroxybutyryl-CoA dehydrogenase [Marinactinospora thermotolerans DSM 45154]